MKFHKVEDMSNSEFTKKIDKWCEEVANKCHEMATRRNSKGELYFDVDFYVFQSELPKLPCPKLLIIGINPGGNSSNEKMKYSYRIKEKDRRTKDDLAQGVNIFTEKNVNNDKMRKVLLGSTTENFTENGIFHNQRLFDLLNDAVIMNMYYFNTKNDLDLYCMCKMMSEMEFCKQKTLELIKILRPNNILFFTTSDKWLQTMGVENIKKMDISFVKEGKLGDKTIYAIPHPSGWAGRYNWDKKHTNAINVGKKLEELFF